MPHTFLLGPLIRVLTGGLLLAIVAANSPADTTQNLPKSEDVNRVVDSNLARKRITELRAEIAHHDALYFQKTTPEITDAAYDALKRELRDLEKNFSAEAAAIAPPPAIADDHTEGFAKVAHSLPMLSLDKAYTEAEVQTFCTKVTATLGHPATFVVEPKIDGLSVSAVYEHGRFVRASTRGNGREGDDITANARMIRSLPRELRATKPDGTPNPIPDLIELRGEIYLVRAEFDRQNHEREADGEPLLAHPRNVATGAIKSRDPNETAERRLDVVFYGWGACEPANALASTQQAFHAQARDWGLPVLETYLVTHDTNETWIAIQALGQKRASLIAPTDGAVIKLDDVSSRTQFGESDHAPRWALAYKYPPERVVTQLRSITIQVGRTGVLTPVAELTPIALGGSTISRATLHNRAQIARLDLRLGDFVYLEKAGEIIPEIIGVDLSRRTTASRPYVFPAKCPACSTPTTADADVTAVRCPNSACPAQLQRRIVYFAGKSCVNLNGLGVATITELIARGCIHSAADLYFLKKNDLLQVPGLGEKSATQLIAEIDRSRGTELWRFINGLGISRVGPTSAKVLARHFGSLEKLARAQTSEFPSSIGSSVSESLQAYLSSEENRAVIQTLASTVHPSTSTTKNEKLSGKVFVLTGKLPTLTREEATQRIEAAGGIVRSGVSKSTNYVVVGSDTGEKLTKAKELNIPVVDEAGLIKLLSDDQTSEAAQ